MPLGVATLMVIGPDTVAGLLGVPVVAHVDNNRVFPKAMFLQFINHLTDVMIGGCHNRTIGTAGGVFHILVERLMFFECLLRVMRNIERHIEEEGAVLVLINKIQGTLHHELGKIFPGRLHRCGALIQIMKTGAVQEVVVIVINESITNPEEFIEALLLGAVIAVRAQMPFAEQGRAVPCRFQCFGQGHFLQGHNNLQKILHLLKDNPHSTLHL